MAVTSEGNTNFKITQGDTFSQYLQYVYTDENGVDTPVNITGYTFTFEAKDKPAGSILCATCTLNDGIEIVSPNEGLILLEVSPDKTRKFNLPQTAYQIQAHNGSQNETWIQGWFKVNPGVID